MKLQDIDIIYVNLSKFEEMSHVEKSRALENLLMTLLTNKADIMNILLSLHASNLIDIKYSDKENQEFRNNFWLEEEEKF